MGRLMKKYASSPVTSRPKPSPSRTQRPPSAVAAIAPDIGQNRERTRGRLAMVLIGLLALVFLGAIVALMAGTISVHDLKELSSFVNPLIVLVGTVTACYFGRATK